MLRTYKLKNYNFILVLSVVALSFIGYFAIGSAKESLQMRQLYGIITGLIFMILVSLLDYSLYSYVKWVIYFVNIALLILVLVAGIEVNGSTRWVNIGFQFQPSELAKILLILFFSAFIMKNKNSLNSFPILASTFLLLAPILFLVYKEPDLSTTIMLTLTFAVMLFVGGLSYKFVLAVLGISIPAGVVFFSLILQDDRQILEGYQVTRILAWLEPEKYADSAAYQQLNSVTAISSGQLVGKGLNNNVIASVKNGNFISEPETDFIYAIVGEELGFIGAVSIIILLLIVIGQCLLIAKNAKDDCGAIICCAMGALVALQGFMNIAVATGFLPNTGIPLPFVSYGLTSLVSMYIGIGVVLNVGLQTTKTH